MEHFLGDGNLEDLLYYWMDFGRYSDCVLWSFLIKDVFVVAAMRDEKYETVEMEGYTAVDAVVVLIVAIDEVLMVDRRTSRKQSTELI